MSNILIESEEYLLSTTQGISEFLQYVAQKNNSRIRLRRFNKVSHKDLQWCDVIVSVRGKSALSYGIAQYAKKNGKYHILYMDDDFLSISDTYGRYGMGIYPKRKQFVNKILQITDCIWVANDSLGNKYVKLSRCKYYVKTDTVVTENDLQPYSAKEANALKLVMYVNDGSTYDFEKIVSPALEEIAQKYKGKLELSLLTLKPDISKIKGNIRVNFVDHMPYPEFRQYMVAENFDIGLAPLVETEFSKYKYINKYFEYSFAGIPGIYSKIPLYASEISDGYNGILCANTKSEWVKGLDRLISSATLREQCVRNAQQSIIEKFSIDNVAQKFVLECPRITKHTSDHKRCRWAYVTILLKQWMFVFGEMTYYSILSLKHGGLKLLIMRVIRYFNRLIKTEHIARRRDKDE